MFYFLIIIYNSYTLSDVRIHKTGSIPNATDLGKTMNQTAWHVIQINGIVFVLEECCHLVYGGIWKV